MATAAKPRATTAAWCGPFGMDSVFQSKLTRILMVLVFRTVLCASAGETIAQHIHKCVLAA